MITQLLHGTLPAREIKEKIKAEIDQLSAKNHRSPSIAVVLIGTDSASHIYVKRKREACSEIGITSLAYNFPEEISEAELLNCIDSLNQNNEIDGILVQLPLPKHIDKNKVIEQILPEKDVDGFHPYNLGKLAQNHPTLRSCTPYGIMTLLEYYKVALSGLHAVIVGASNIVGRPMALELLNAKCTVTVCHSHTKTLEKYVKEADLLVCAIGKRKVIQNDWINPSTIVIDVGIHRENNKVVGDLDFDFLKDKVKMITPVPGGVGPMTVAMLMHNTFLAYRRNILG